MPRTSAPRPSTRRKSATAQPPAPPKPLPAPPAATIDLERDVLAPVAEHARRMLGREPSYEAITRWAKGVGAGGPLECYSVAGVWVTTAAAFADWVRRQTEARRETSRRHANVRAARAVVMTRQREAQRKDQTSDDPAATAAEGGAACPR